MAITIHQSIQINLLKIGSISNSSFVQIGSSGSIQALSNLYNTGGFTEPAPETGELLETTGPLVPLT
ncbi:spore germination protein GerPB [Bacillaceae bacterium S4-13-56]